MEIEASGRAGFIGYYIDPEREKLRICILPWLPICIRLKPKQVSKEHAMTMLEKVQEIITDQLGCNKEQAAEDANIAEDLGADSLDQVELVMEFEEEFGIEIADEDAAKLITPGHIAKYLTERGCTC